MSFRSVDNEDDEDNDRVGDRDVAVVGVGVDEDDDVVVVTPAGPFTVLERSTVNTCWTSVRNEEINCAALLPYWEGVGASCADFDPARSSCVRSEKTLLAIRTTASMRSSQRVSSKDSG